MLVWYGVRFLVANGLSREERYPAVAVTLSRHMMRTHEVALRLPPAYDSPD
jgi:hypothetical protein